MSSLRKQAFQSTIWSAAGQYSTHALSLITAAVLGRLLDPADFGLIGMILAANAFLTILSNAGMSSTVVQFKDLNRKSFQALLGLAGLVGILSAALLAISAPSLALFFREPRLELIAYVWTPALFFIALSQVPQGILQREFLFVRRTWTMILSALFASVIAIYLAYQGFGYWALVIQVLSRSLLHFLFSMLAARLSMCPRFDLVLYKRVFSYTGNLTLFQFVNYFHRNLDNLLIGRFLGAVQLGYYTRAYSLLQFFNSSLGGVIQPVLHAAMAKRQDDLPALRRSYGQVVEFILWFSAPIMALAAVFSPEIIRLVWGPGWESAETPFFWLAIAGMHQGVYATIGTAFSVRYKTKELLMCGMVTTVHYGFAIIIGLSGGIDMVAKYYSIMSLLIFVPLMLYVWRVVLGGAGRQLFGLILKPILFSSLLGLVGGASKRLVAPFFIGQAEFSIAIFFSVSLLFILLVYLVFAWSRLFGLIRSLR